MGSLTSTIPNPSERLIDANGYLTANWRRFFINFQAEAIGLTPILNTLSTFSSQGLMTYISATQVVGRTITASTGITVTNGQGLFGNPTISITATGVTAASYGAADSVGTFTVNAQGQLTVAASTPIQITEAQVTNLTTDLAAKLTASSNLSDLTNAATARTNLGLGSIATQAANNVAITGGAIDGVTIGNTTAATICNVDNLRLDLNTISSTNANGDIAVNPNGTGSITTTASVKLGTTGKGLFIKEGSNATMGTATLVAGTVTVNNTLITATSRIFLTPQNSSGTAGSVYISARVASTSFTITSTSATDTRDVAWLLVEPA